MTLRPQELRLVLGEVAAELVGRPVQKVVQPGPHRLLLGFPSRWLLVDVGPRSGRLHLLSEKPPGTGEAAPAFCMLLRKLLVGARLTEVEVVLGERAAALGFVRSDGAPRLLAFLYGVGGRLVLVDDSGEARGAIGPGRRSPTTLPPPQPEEPSGRFPAPPWSAVIAEHYRSQEEEAQAAATQSQAAATLRHELARLRRRQTALLGDLERAQRAVAMRRFGDLLFAHLGEVPRGAREVTLTDDFADGGPITIPLDPARGPQENAARFYREHQRMNRGRRLVEARLIETEQAIVAAEAALAEPRPPPPVPQPALGPRGRRREQQPKPPYRTYRAADGTPILVGRGAERNDRLTFGVARGNDLWLHTRDAPGAHVIVPSPRGEVDPEILIDAALLAIHHSPLRDELSADVTVAQRKHLRKVRGAAGRVTVAAGRTLRVRTDIERLRRLLASRVDD